MIEVVLVDEHTVVREAIRHTLEQARGFVVTGEAGTGTEAVRLCRELRPHVVLLELEAGGLSGPAAIDEILRASPQTRVVVLTAQDDQDAAVSALCAGAHGFVPKRAQLAELLEAIRAVSQGSVYVSRELSASLFEYFQSHLRAKPSAQASAGLTPRETQVLRMISEGMTSKEIAHVTSLSPETVRSYRKTLMAKLEVHNVAQLTQAAIRLRLVRKPVKAFGAPAPGDLAGAGK